MYSPAVPVTVPTGSSEHASRPPSMRGPSQRSANGYHRRLPTTKALGTCSSRRGHPSPAPRRDPCHQRPPSGICPAALPPGSIQPCKTLPLTVPGHRNTRWKLAHTRARHAEFLHSSEKSRAGLSVECENAGIALDPSTALLRRVLNSTGRTRVGAHGSPEALRRLLAVGVPSTTRSLGWGASAHPLAGS